VLNAWDVETYYVDAVEGQFPSYTSQVAPGLSCVYHIRFSPDALCDFDDVLIVETLTSSPLYVPLLARRPPPVLTRKFTFRIFARLLTPMPPPVLARKLLLTLYS